MAAASTMFQITNHGNVALKRQLVGHLSSTLIGVPSLDVSTLKEETSICPFSRVTSIRPPTNVLFESSIGRGLLAPSIYFYPNEPGIFTT